MLKFVNLIFEFVNSIVFWFDYVKELGYAFVRGFVSVFISSKDSHNKSRDRLISASSDSSLALAMRLPAFGMASVIVFARLCGLPVANCLCRLLSFVLCTAATNVTAHYSCYCSSSERSGESKDAGLEEVNFQSFTDQMGEIAWG